MVGWRPRRSADHASDHSIREAHLDQVRNAVEEFAYTLAQLIAGTELTSDAAGRDVAAPVQIALEPFLCRGDVMRPDFGAFGELRVEGDLLQTRPVLATLEFDDRSVRQTVDGRLMPARRRRLRLTMHVAVEPARVIDCAFSEVT